MKTDHQKAFDALRNFDKELLQRFRRKIAALKSSFKRDLPGGTIMLPVYSDACRQYLYDVSLIGMRSGIMDGVQHALRLYSEGHRTPINPHGWKEKTKQASQVFYDKNLELIAEISLEIERVGVKP